MTPLAYHTLKQIDTYIHAYIHIKTRFLNQDQTISTGRGLSSSCNMYRKSCSGGGARGGTGGASLCSCCLCARRSWPFCCFTHELTEWNLGRVSTEATVDTVSRRLGVLVDFHVG